MYVTVYVKLMENNTETEFDLLIQRFLERKNISIVLCKSEHINANRCPTRATSFSFKLKHFCPSGRVAE